MAATLTFQPKKQQIHVPGHGVIQRENFTKEHFKILMKRAGEGERRDAFIKQHFEVASYGDQPLFQGMGGKAQDKPSEKGRGGRKANSKPGDTPTEGTENSGAGKNPTTDVVEINLDVTELSKQTSEGTEGSEAENKPE